MTSDIKPAQFRTRERNVRPPEAKGHRGFRGDLEGLRTVAVLVVIADHLFHYPSGGFVGVDIFFVLSGFLITGLLLREIDKTGRISFSDFYRRRVRRILPVATLVLVVTVGASYVVFRTGRAAGIFTDALWAATFAGNWQQILSGTDYMNVGVTKSPLQHYWSLGVEEQFYVAWPLLILGLAWIAVRLQLDVHNRMRVIGGGLAAVVVVLFVFSLWDTSYHPTVAYFSTFSRGWELGLGALLAVWTPAFAFLSNGVRMVLGWLGLILILLAVFFLGPESPFPGPWAILPVAGAMAIIVAGSGANESSNYSNIMMPLTNPISRYIGRISFSLYLWHFPVIVLLQSVFGTGGLKYYLIVMVLTAALSMASYHLVEDPVRRSKWLEPVLRLDGRRVNQNRRLARERIIFSAAVASIGILMSAAAISNYQQSHQAVTVVDQQQGPGVAVVPLRDRTEADHLVSSSSTVAHNNQELAISAALQTKKWSVLSPDLDSFGDLGRAVKSREWIVDGCLGSEGSSARVADPIENSVHCVYGDSDSKYSLVIYGDSTAISYVPGIRAALQGQSWRIHVLTTASCPVAAVSQVRPDGSAFPECDAFRAAAVKEISTLNPDLTIISEARTDEVLSSHATGAAADTERAAGLDKTLGQLATGNIKILHLSAPPPGKNLADCATQISTPADCEVSVTDSYARNSAIERAAIDKLGSGAIYVDTTTWFCVSGRCPAFIGSTPMRADIYHLADAGARQLAPLLAHTMNEALGKSQ